MRTRVCARVLGHKEFFPNRRSPRERVSVSSKIERRSSDVFGCEPTEAIGLFFGSAIFPVLSSVLLFVLPNVPPYFLSSVLPSVPPLVLPSVRYSQLLNFSSSFLFLSRSIFSPVRSFLFPPPPRRTDELTAGITQPTERRSEWF